MAPEGDTGVGVERPGPVDPGPAVSAPLDLSIAPYMAPCVISHMQTRIGFCYQVHWADQRDYRSFSASLEGFTGWERDTAQITHLCSR